MQVQIQNKVTRLQEQPYQHDSIPTQVMAYSGDNWGPVLTTVGAHVGALGYTFIRFNVLPANDASQTVHQYMRVKT